MCDTQWDYQDASIVCSQVGLSHHGEKSSILYSLLGNPPCLKSRRVRIVCFHVILGAIPVATGVFGDDIESTVLYDVDCSGNETGLGSCVLSFSGTCSHEHNVGVICQGGKLSPFGEHFLLLYKNLVILQTDTVNDNCTHGDLRIASRSDDESALSSEGRLEICVNGVWGTICDFKYGTRDAKVACRQLGYDDEGRNPSDLKVAALECVFLLINYRFKSTSTIWRGYWYSVSRRFGV